MPIKESICACKRCNKKEKQHEKRKEKLVMGLKNIINSSIYIDR